MDLQVIRNTIEDLEASENTFENCSKLASLYIIRAEAENVNKNELDSVQKELNDVLPAYGHYTSRKRGYQLGNCPEELVVEALNAVCVEIREFIQSLYSNTDMPKERNLIRNLISNLQEIA